MQLKSRWCQGRAHGDGDLEQRLWEVSRGGVRQKSIPGRGNGKCTVGKVCRFCNDYLSYCMTFILSNIIVDNFLDSFRDKENETWKILYTVSKFSCLLSSQNIKDCGKFRIAHQTPLFWKKDWPNGIEWFLKVTPLFGGKARARILNSSAPHIGLFFSHVLFIVNTLDSFWITVGNHWAF